jgi:hypothetical protein
MRRFLRYPIYVNHPGRWQLVRERQMAEFAEKRDRHMLQWLEYTGKNLYETIEDKNPPPNAVAYEKGVIEALQVIATTQIGRLLLGSLDQNIRYWIIPLDAEGLATCKCGAFTFPGAPKEGGGIRVYYNPTDFNSPSRRWISADDVLFHELVHAYRMGRWGYQAVNAARPMANYQDSEEFVATQMQNVYLGARGSDHYYGSYPTMKRTSKDSAYQAIARDREALGEFNYYVNTDSLMATVAGWMTPATSFNPFRDRGVLGRIGGMP